MLNKFPKIVEFLSPERYNSQMSVEAFCWKLAEKGEDTLEESLSVLPGDLAPIDFLDKVRLVTFCDQNNEIASIWIVGEKLGKHIRAIVCKNKEDLEDEGEVVKIDPKKPVIRIVQPQKLSIYSGKKLDKAVVLCLEEEDWDDDEYDDGDFDGDDSDDSPEDSPEKSRFLVLV